VVFAAAEPHFPRARDQKRGKYVSQWLDEGLLTDAEQVAKIYLTIRGSNSKLTSNEITGVYVGIA
jgi:hypothetical protein